MCAYTYVAPSRFVCLCVYVGRWERVEQHVWAFLLLCACEAEVRAYMVRAHALSAMAAYARRCASDTHPIHARFLPWAPHTNPHKSHTGGECAGAERKHG